MGFLDTRHPTNGLCFGPAFLFALLLSDGCWDAGFVQVSRSDWGVQERPALGIWIWQLLEGSSLSTASRNTLKHTQQPFESEQTYAPNGRWCHQHAQTRMSAPSALSEQNRSMPHSMLA